MKYVVTLLILSYLMSSCLSKKDRENSSVPASITYERISGENSWGFVDSQGDTIIPLGKYTFLNPIDEEGMILAQLGEKHGYINIHEQIVIPFDYEDLGVFSHALAPAKKNGKYGYLDRKGKVVIPFQYDNESYFRSSGLAIAEINNKVGFIDIQGKEVIPIKFEQVNQAETDSLVLVQQNNKWAFFSNAGVQLTDFVYDELVESDNYTSTGIESTYFGNGLVLVKKGKQIAYLNQHLKEIIPFGLYKSGEPFNQNRLAIVSKNKKYNIIDESGNQVLKQDFDFIEHPSRYSNQSEVFVVQNKSFYQLLDKSAKPITEFNIKEYDWDYVRSKGNILVLENSLKQAGAILENGTVVIPFEYQQINLFDGNPATIAKKSGKYGIINYENKIILPFEYEEIYSDQFFNYYILTKQNKVGMTHKNGEVIFDFTYQHIEPCHYNNNELFIVKANNKYGIIDKQGKPVIPIDYDRISNWVEYGPDAHFVTKDGKKGMISRRGEMLIPVVYDQLQYINYSIVIVSREGKYGVITIHNKPVIPFEYEAIYTQWQHPFEYNENAEFYVKKNGRYSIIDKFNMTIKGNISEKEVKEKFGPIYFK